MFGDGDAYDCEVNTGDLSMHWLKSTLNARARDGWVFVQAFEQAGNTVVVFQRSNEV